MKFAHLNFTSLPGAELSSFQMVVGFAIRY
jgi:hypothetical protein